MRDRPHDIDEQAGRTERDEPVEFGHYEEDEASGDGPSTMDGLHEPMSEADWIRSKGFDPVRTIEQGEPVPLTRAHRLDDPCTIGLAVRIAKEIVREERWHRRLARWWRRRLVQLRRTTA